MTTPSDPQRGEQQPDDESRSATPDGGTGAPEPGQPQQQPGGEQPGGYGEPGQQQPNAQPGQYGGQPGYGQPGQYGPQDPYGGQPAYGQGQYGGQYGQPGSYGQYGEQPGWPGQYNPYAQPGQYGAGPPYGHAPGDRVYNPYGSEPAGLDAEDRKPVERPGIMVLALVLLLLSALPFLALGAVLLTFPIDLSALPPELDIEQQLEQAGLSAEAFVSFLRGMAAVILGLALIYVLFAVLAFLGHNWARIVVTIMTVGFGLFLLAGLLSSASGDPAGAVLFLAILALSLAGTVMLFRPGPNAYYRRARR